MTPRPGRAHASARFGAILLVVGVVAALAALALWDGDDDAAVVAADRVAHRSWDVPDAVDLAVVGDDVWILSKGDAYSISRFDEDTGELRDRRTIAGSRLSMTSAGENLWLWGEVHSADVQEALDSGSKELPTTGRVGIAHRVSVGPDGNGDDRTWDLGPTVPIILVAEGDRAWTYAVDAATFMASSLVHLGGRRDGDTDRLAGQVGAYSFVLDGDRLLIDDLRSLLVIDRDTGEIIDRREPRRLQGRTADGRLWADVGDVLSFRVRAIDDGTVLEASGHVATVAGGIAVGTRWFDGPDDDPEVDAVLEELPDTMPYLGPEPLGDVAYYLETRRPDARPPTRLHRWAPRHDERVRPMPRTEPPSQIGSGDCEPLSAGFLTDDAGDWGESAVEDDNIPGAIRRQGPDGSYVVAVPGPAPWITGVPGAEDQPPPEGFRSFHIVRIPDGFAAQAVPTDSPREAPCDAVTLLGYDISADELRSQVSIAGTVQHTDRTPL